MVQYSQADSIFVLPPEIIHSILSTLDKPTLTSCSLASKSLLTHARQVLHQKVIIRTTDPLARLEEFSRVYDNPKLAEIVRELTFLGDFCSPDWWGHSPGEKESIAYILTQTIPVFARAVTKMTFTTSTGRLICHEGWTYSNHSSLSHTFTSLMSHGITISLGNNSFVLLLPCQHSSCKTFPATRVSIQWTSLPKNLLPVIAWWICISKIATAVLRESYSKFTRRNFAPSVCGPGALSGLCKRYAALFGSP